MKLGKIFVLLFSLIPIFSVASHQNETPILPSLPEQEIITTGQSVIPLEIIEPTSLHSKSKAIFLKNQEQGNPHHTITINLSDLSYEEFLSFMRFLDKSKFQPKIQIPPSYMDSYDHVKPLYQPYTPDKTRTEFNILNLSGGGTRGYLQAYVLQYITSKTGKEPHELFDFAIGTSTGCFTIAGAFFDKCIMEKTDTETPHTLESRPYTMEEITTLYTEESKVIFGKYHYTSMKGLNGTQYNSTPLKNTAKKYFGNVQLGDAKIPVIFMAQNLSTASPILYCSDEVKRGKSTNKPLCDIIQEATSAPTYFDPVITEEGTIIADAGMTYNNPIPFGLSEGARILNVSPNNLNIFSIETGFTKPTPNSSYQNLRALDWLGIISTNIFNGTSQHIATEQMIKALQKQDLFQGEGEYLRVQFDLPAKLYQLSDYTHEFFAGLKEIADNYIAQNQKQLDAYIEKLMRAKGFL